METNRYNKKFYDAMAATSPTRTGALLVVRQIDPAVCERADRDVQIPYRHALSGTAEIRRKEKIAWWESDPDIVDDPVVTAPSGPDFILVPPPPALRGLTKCDASG